MENFANFLVLFNQDTRRLIRNIANIEKKLIKCQPTSCCIQRNMFEWRYSAYLYQNVYV